MFSRRRGCIEGRGNSDDVGACEVVLIELIPFEWITGDE